MALAIVALLGSLDVARAQSGDTSRAIAQWQVSNATCRNAKAPALEAVAACEQRDTLSKLLALMNHCYGRSDKSRPASWSPCDGARAAESAQSARSVAQFQRMGGVFVLPVMLNGKTRSFFVVDSGAANVQVPQEVVDELARDGTLGDGDSLGERRFVVADGRRLSQRLIRLRSVQVGTRSVENVLAAVGAPHSQALLGQSLLKRLNWWKIDNVKNAIELEFTGSY